MATHNKSHGITKINETCLNGSYNVDVQLTGGLGSTSHSRAYQLVTDGSTSYQNVSPNEILSFGPYFTGGNFTIKAYGAKGCKSSYTQNVNCGNSYRKFSYTLNADVIKVAYANKNENIQSIEVYSLNAQQIPAKLNIDRHKGELRLLTSKKGLYIIKILLANNEVDYIKLLR